VNGASAMGSIDRLVRLSRLRDKAARVVLLRRFLDTMPESFPNSFP
jgi:hypothetical protein